MTLDADVARFARTPPFNLMPREAVQLVAFSSERRLLKAGEILFRAGEVGEAGFFIYSGVVLLIDKDVAPESARRVAAGALIGENALYAPVVRRVEARAAEDAVVMRVSRETFRRVLIEFPAAADKVRAALAERTRKLVDGLDAARLRSIAAAAPKPRAAS